MAKVIMNSQEYINRLKILASRPTYYSNKYPYNLCYVHKDGRTSADCWNLIKAILNGYDVTRHDVGYFQKNLTNTGDCDGATLMRMCTDVSTDFTKLRDGEPRLLYMSGHAGSFIGYTQLNGHEYNVIESTGAWERKILYSWVDADGTRRRWRGGEKKGKWLKNGMMTPWVAYKNIPTPAPVPQPIPQPTPSKEEYDMPTIKKGSKGKAVKIWQIILGITADGVFGPITESKTKQFQQKNGLESDGIVGPITWKVGLNSVK